MRILETAQAVQDRDVVFLHEKINPAHCLLHHFAFPSDHALEVQFQATGLDAMDFKLMSRLVKMFGAVKQRFRRNAPDIQACSAE